MFRFPPTQSASVLGESIEYVCAGIGPATVVLVNGSGGPIEGWYKIFSSLTTFAKVVAYNRPGLGKSSQPSVPQVGCHLVASLRALLLVAGFPPPYVLVGHSLGGLLVNLYARLHSSEVEAVVLLDSTSPEDPDDLTTHERGWERIVQRGMEWLAPRQPNDEIRHIATGEAHYCSPKRPFPAVLRA